MRLHRSSYYVAGAVLCAVLLLPEGVLAKDPKPVIRDSAYSARYVSQSIADPVAITAGETKTVTVRFKNTGTAAWAATGAKYISAYTMEPRDRTSSFQGSGWKSAKQTGSIAKAAKPGETAELAIAFTAPAVPGTYTEHFYLAAENHSWVQGGYFFITFTVKAAPAGETPNATVPSETAPTPSLSYKANRFIQNKKTIEAKGGEIVDLVVGFQNLGSAPWKEYGFVPRGGTSIAAVAASFADDSWASKNLIMRRQQEIAPSGFIREIVRFRAPARAGTYTAAFHLQVDGVTLPDAYVELPVTVTENAPEHYVEPWSDGSAAIPTYALPTEPRIRVGLWQPDTFVQFRSEEAEYDVYDGLNKVWTLPVGTLGVLKFENGMYSFTSGDFTFSTNQYIRLSPVDHPHAVFTLYNYTRRVSWKGPGNFNRYRGALEYRLGETRADLWVVNDLLLEDYIKGVAENANSSPIEYLKAQTVAQRSYAYATIQSDKYGIFDVVATTGDQLYLGVESERITPNFVAAAEATRGIMALYGGKVVLTPYFGNSDCRTRSWTEVWGGSTKPWLVSVPATYDCAAGRRKNGHGVGMSQLDASARAKEGGADFRALVSYYYTGVGIERMYE